MVSAKKIKINPAALQEKAGQIVVRHGKTFAASAT
jgi:hypothetical protein